MTRNVCLLGLLILFLASCGGTRHRTLGGTESEMEFAIDCKQNKPHKCQIRAKELCRYWGEDFTVLEEIKLKGSRWHLTVKCGP